MGSRLNSLHFLILKFYREVHLNESAESESCERAGL